MKSTLAMTEAMKGASKVTKSKSAWLSPFVFSMAHIVALLAVAVALLSGNGEDEQENEHASHAAHHAQVCTGE